LGVALSDYADAIVRNVRAERARKGLEQRDLVDRMRALGCTNWHRQTLSRVERGERRLLAEEMFVLALALETSIPRLMGYLGDEKAVELPSGPIEAADVMALASGRNNGAVHFDGNVPVHGKGTNAWWGDREDDPALKAEG
jgi:transcriptional regulator with XRE-family HTH domain